MMYALLPKDSRDKYLKTWNQFRSRYNLSTEKAPCQDDFLDFFDWKIKNGEAPTSLTSYYSHLNKAVLELYDYKLQKFPKIFNLINSSKRGSIKKKAKIFEPDEIQKFFHDLVHGN